MEITSEQLEMMWAGVYLAVKFLGWTFIWCFACGIINKGVGG